MMWHESVALGLAYDSNVPVTARIPQARVEVRPIRSEDVPAFTSLPPATSPRAEALTRINARHLLESGLQTCYVGVTEAGPVYMQFLVTPDQNERLRQVFRGLFPPLADDEGLLEFAFTLQEHRAPPVMPAVLLRLIEISAQRGLARVVAYVHMENQILLRFFLRIGFEPFTVRTERWRLFQRRVEFRPLQHDVSERLAARGGLASSGDVKAGQLPGAASPSADE